VSETTDAAAASSTICRTDDWIAQWKETIEDPHQKLGRPRQRYTGSPKREYQPISRRK
jgi:citrate synthase